MKPRIILLCLAGPLLAGTLDAQNRPDLPPDTGVGIVRALPIDPNIGPNDPVPMPFPEPGGEFVEPGFPGEFMMEGIPGRYQMISANIQQNGKTIPVVLKLDTMNGQVWRLLVTTHTLMRNGKPQVETRMEFSPILTQGQPIRPAHPVGGAAGGGFAPGRAVPLPAPVDPLPEFVPNPPRNREVPPPPPQRPRPPRTEP